MPSTTKCNLHRISLLFAGNQSLFWRFSAVDITESRLGCGRKFALLLSWCEDGRIKAVNARLTQSPSTPPILTSEFVIADLRMFKPLDEYADDAWWWPLLPDFLCRLHRKEPGWVVGEHMHGFLGRETGEFRLETVMDRLGEPDRWSMENRTERDRGVEEILTRVGEVGRWWLWSSWFWKKVEDPEEKPKLVEAANGEVPGEEIGEWNRAAAGNGRRTGPLVSFFMGLGWFCVFVGSLCKWGFRIRFGKLSSSRRWNL